MKRNIQRLKNLFHYKDLLLQLVSRDIKLKYRRSFLGYLWSVLNPLMIMAVQAIVFSTMFKHSVEHFPVYLISGQIMFSYMSGSTHISIHAIVSNADLLKKTYIPKYIFVLSKITSGFVDFIFSLGALVVVTIVTRVTFGWAWLAFPLVAMQLYAFCLGLGLFLAQTNVFFRDTQYIYNAVTTAWMYLTPIFYPVEALPASLQWGVTHLNPMSFYVQQFRMIVLDNALPDSGLMLRGCIAAVLVLLLGLLSFKRGQDRFILYI